MPSGAPLIVADPLPIVGVVSLAGVADLRRAWEMRLSNGVVDEFLGGAPDAVPDHYRAASPREMVPLGVRTVLVHGTADPNVPFEISQLYYIAALASGDAVTLVPLPDLGHFEVIDPYSAAWPAVLGAVRHVLT